MSQIRLTSSLNRLVLINIIKAFDSGNFPMAAHRIPYEMRPKNSKPQYRCCIHKERAAIRERTIAGLGFSVAEDDHIKLLTEYAQDALERTKVDSEVLTAIDTACQGCRSGHIHVTDMCQGCVAQSCVSSCKFGAIRVENSKAVIDDDKCKNCGLCVKACSYNAISRLRVPCEEACPVGAIHKNEQGVIDIDFERCISCGACVAGCPFGAIHEKSQMIDILKEVKGSRPVVAMVAPAVQGQFPESLPKIASALIAAGFSHVLEVAEGADLTTMNEAAEFAERMEEGEPFMTTSCCAAYKELVRLHMPEMKPYVSETPTPMHYTAKIAKERFPGCVTVFVGPCVAKKKEGLDDDYVDYVMSIEELGSLFVAREIELSECEDYSFHIAASSEGRGFAVTGGVSGAVAAAAGEDCPLKSHCVDGLDKKAIALMRNYAKKGECPEGNLIEVMVCQGGCVGGSSVLNDTKKASVKVKTYSAESKSILDIVKT